jgi:hypothetical protein
MADVERKQSRQVAYLVIGALALVNGGCLAVAAGAAAGGGAAVGYAYFAAPTYREHNANLTDTQIAVLAALKDLQFPLVNQKVKGEGTSIESRTTDGKEIAITLESQMSRVPAVGPVTRVSIRVGTFGDDAVATMLHNQIEAHLLPANQAVVPPRPPETKEPPKLAEPEPAPKR